MNFPDNAANSNVSYVYSNCLLHLLPHLLYCRGLWGRSTCQWTTVTPGTWPSCPLLVTSSSTPFWQPMMKWSSCTSMSQEVSWHRTHNYLSFLLCIIINTSGRPWGFNPFRVKLLCVCLCLWFRRFRIWHYLRVRWPWHGVLEVPGTPPLHHHRGWNGLH